MISERTLLTFFHRTDSVSLMNCELGVSRGCTAKGYSAFGEELTRQPPEHAKKHPRIETPPGLETVSVRPAAETSFFNSSYWRTPSPPFSYPDCPCVPNRIQIRTYTYPLELDIAFVVFVNTKVDHLDRKRT